MTAIIAMGTIALTIASMAFGVSIALFIALAKFKKPSLRLISCAEKIDAVHDLIRQCSILLIAEIERLSLIRKRKQSSTEQNFSVEFEKSTGNILFFSKLNAVQLLPWNGASEFLNWVSDLMRNRFRPVIYKKDVFFPYSIILKQLNEIFYDQTNRNESIIFRIVFIMTAECDVVLALSDPDEELINMEFGFNTQMVLKWNLIEDIQRVDKFSVEPSIELIKNIGRKQNDKKEGNADS